MSEWLLNFAHDYPRIGIANSCCNRHIFIDLLMADSPQYFSSTKISIQVHKPPLSVHCLSECRQFSRARCGMQKFSKFDSSCHTWQRPSSRIVTCVASE